MKKDLLDKILIVEDENQEVESIEKSQKILEGERHRPFLKKEIENERMREGMHNLSKEQISFLETANAKIQNNLDDTATKMLERDDQYYKAVPNLREELQTVKTMLQQKEDWNMEFMNIIITLKKDEKKLEEDVVNATTQYSDEIVPALG